MSFEKSAGAIIFRPEQHQIKYLLLHYPSITHRSQRDYWDFVKGHIEKGRPKRKQLFEKQKKKQD